MTHQCIASPETKTALRNSRKFALSKLVLFLPQLAL